jgi:hypothetical protein
VLAFLDALCAALIARDAEHIRRLLAHPLARALPRGVRDEANAMAQGAHAPFGAPLRTLRLYHQTAHLLGVSADPATRRGTVVRPTRAPRRQMELPLETLAAS